jgi:hypothetical protein
VWSSSRAPKLTKQMFFFFLTILPWQLNKYTSANLPPKVQHTRLNDIGTAFVRREAHSNGRGVVCPHFRGSAFGNTGYARSSEYDFQMWYCWNVRGGRKYTTELKRKNNRSVERRRIAFLLCVALLDHPGPSAPRRSTREKNLSGFLVVASQVDRTDKNAEGPPPRLGLVHFLDKKEKETKINQ